MSDWDYPLDHRLGYSLIPRAAGTFDPLVRSGSLCQVYVVLTTRVRHNTGFVQGSHGPIQLTQGQCICGHRELGKATGLNPKTAERALKKLEEFGLITRKPSHLGTVVTLVNYGEFRGSSDPPVAHQLGQPLGHQLGQPLGHQLGHRLGRPMGRDMGRNERKNGEEYGDTAVSPRPEDPPAGGSGAAASDEQITLPGVAAADKSKRSGKAATTTTELLRYFDAQFEDWRGEPRLGANRRADNPRAKKLVDALGLEECKLRVDRWFSQPRKGYSFGFFVTCINDLGQPCQPTTPAVVQSTEVEDQLEREEQERLRREGIAGV